MTANDEFRIPKLTADNYHAWRLRARAALVQKTCWEAIEPGFGPSMSNDERRKNDKALTFLFLVVEDNYLDDIGECERASEAWETLQTIHTKFGLLHTLQLLRDLFNVTKQSKEPMTEYLGRIMNIQRKLKDSGHSLGDREIAMVMLMGLPRDYEPLILKLEQDEEDLSCKLVKAKLLVEEKRQVRRQKEDENAVKLELTENLALASRTEQTTSSNPETTKTDTKTKPRFIRCFCCGKLGHIARNCHYAKKKTDDTKLPPKGAHKAEKEVAMQVALSATNSEQSELTWLLDSGASDHMTCHRHKFETLEPFEGTVKTANKKRMKVAGVGRVVLQLSDINGGWEITLARVLYIPELDGNLLSVGKLEEKGLSLLAKEGCLTAMQANNVKVFSALRINGVYSVREKDTEGKALSVDRGISKELLHQRMGHLHIRGVEKLGGKYKITFDKDMTSTDRTCDTCIEGKMTRTVFPINHISKAKRPLDLIHSDVVGPITPTSCGGANYFVTFVDEFTRYTRVYVMKHKSEVFAKFVEYRKLVEREHGYKIGALRSDNGGEYASHEFVNYCKQKGIRREFTVPRTPQQNGTAERMNRTLLDMTRCLLLGSAMPKRFWADAITTACYIRNKCPSRACEDQIPEQLWYGVEPQLSHLRIYGCKVWAADTKEGKQKFASRAMECVLIGYPEGIKGYKLWDYRQDKVFVSRDVQFDETCFPMKQDDCTTVGDTADENCSVGPRIVSKDMSPITIENEGKVKKEKRVGFFEHEDDVNYDEDRTQMRLGALPTNIRYSQRLASNRNFQLACTSETDYTSAVPLTINQALSSLEADRWQDAIQDEMHNLQSRNTWELVKRPIDQHVIGTKWIFAKKKDENGETVRYRARLVAQGHMQIPGVDYTETFSPVIKLKSLRILLALSVELQWKTRHLDVVAAYLNATLQEEVFMEHPFPSQDDDGTDLVCALKKGIYGLHQAGREWNKALDTYLQQQGLKRSKADPCVYYDEGKLIIGVYVDDCPIIGKDDPTIDALVTALNNKFEIRDLGPIHHILSIRVMYGVDGTLSLDQEEYITVLANRYHIDSGRGVSTPLDPGTHLCRRGNEETVPVFPYREFIGSLLYLAAGTRPDVAFAASYLGQFTEQPSSDCVAAAKHVLRYLLKTKEMKLTFHKTEETIVGYSDSDWARDQTDRKSVSGYVYIMAGSAVSWSSRKQRTTALSSVEAEYLALCEAAKEALWLKAFLDEIQMCRFVRNPLEIKVDNQGAMCLANKQVVSNRNKHIPLRYFFLRELVENKATTFTYVPTVDNCGDLFTKPVKKVNLIKHLSTLNISF